MMITTLFPREQVVGIFRGFSEGGLEFHADLVVPYRSELQRIPMHGQFLVVQLETDSEGVLGRITAVSSEGRLVSGAGEEYGLRAIAEDREIPEDLRQQYLRYRVNIRVLGVLRLVNGEVVFAPSHRRLPHVGSRVAFLSDELLRHVVGHYGEGVEIGFFSLGEFIYAGDDRRLVPKPWMRIVARPVLPRFNVQQLVSRRTFVFARAGFGKSNLNKLLFSSLYKQTPTVEKRGSRRIPVGTVIFDPEGEYFWPDDKNRPGLCDVPELQDQLVVFTDREPPTPFYGSFVAGKIRLDIRRLRPADVLAIALSPEKQEQQNVRKLKGLRDEDWKTLVDEIYREGNAANLDLIKHLLKLEDSQEAEALAARGNMTTVVRMLHDPSSQLLDMLVAALRDGKLCVVDVSQMRGTPAFILSGIILQKIFDTNQEEFTSAQPRTIPTIAVVEEAQAVLGAREATGAEGPYVAWVKEGRKYDLGAVLITQQPGSISHELLSQGDNWFIFHLLSEGDLKAVQRANAHFSSDLLSSLLNEPIPGHAVFWSSAGGMSYPISVRVLSFEHLYSLRDPDGTLGPVETYASRLRRKFEEMVRHAREMALAGPSVDKEAGAPVLSANGASPAGQPLAQEEAPDEPGDVLQVYQEAALRRVQQDRDFVESLRRNGAAPWRRILERIKQELPEEIAEEERGRIANGLVPQFLGREFGPRGSAWTTETRPSRSGPGHTLWVVLAAAFAQNSQGRESDEG